MMRFAAASLLAACIVLPVHAQHADHAQHPQGEDRDKRPESVSPPASPAPLPEPTAEERAAAFPVHLEGMDMRMHMDDNPLIAVLRVDELEYGEDEALGWHLRAGLGRNFDKLWLRSEGERTGGRTGHATTELYWSHATGPWWDRTLGMRHDTGQGGPSRTWAGLGVQGLAPYRFEIEAMAYVGESGRLAARFEGEYEILLTNRLILQPKLEADLYSRDDPANRIGSGLSEAEFGLRLRYEFSPRFAPYIGHVWSRKFAATADFAEADSDEASDQGWVAGVRFWF